ncbi:MAG: pyruvate kinase, partial [Planctomycetaceae bacterium]
MDLRSRRHTERPLVKTKIIATVGPACDTPAMLRELVLAGADLFRLNFAHGSRESLDRIVRFIREISKDLERPIAILGDLAGPKIRLGQLPDDGVRCDEGGIVRFVKDLDPDDPTALTSSYPDLLDDLRTHDRLLLVDGTVSLRVVDKSDDGSEVRCVVEQPGVVRSRQGVNLPGVRLNTPSLTDKDRDDLKWALAHGLDFIGLSFVRSADDIVGLRAAIEALNPETHPHIIAKIEKMEAVDGLEAILDVTDGVMVARGDLGVEVDIARVPPLQKRII